MLDEACRYVAQHRDTMAAGAVEFTMAYFMAHKYFLRS
jgi:hypothetical protein